MSSCRLTTVPRHLFGSSLEGSSRAIADFFLRSRALILAQKSDLSGPGWCVPLALIFQSQGGSDQQLELTRKELESLAASRGLH
jgi:hypothetical protein